MEENKIVSKTPQKVKNIKLVYDNWEDMPVRIYLELLRLAKEPNEVEDVLVKEMSILCDCTEDDILDLSFPAYQELRRKTEFMTAFPIIKPKHTKYITINGKEYVVAESLKKFTTGQYIDFQNFYKENDLSKYLPNILSCFLIPKGRSYGEYDVMEVMDDMLDMPLKVAMELTGFFTMAYLRSFRSSLICLERKNQKMMRRTRNQKEKEMRKEVGKMMRKTILELNGGGSLT